MISAKKHGRIHSLKSLILAKWSPLSSSRKPSKPCQRLSSCTFCIPGPEGWTGKQNARSRKLTHGFSGKWSNDGRMWSVSNFVGVSVCFKRMSTNLAQIVFMVKNMEQWIVDWIFDFASRNDVKYAGCKWGAPFLRNPFTIQWHECLRGSHHKCKMG